MSINLKYSPRPKNRIFIMFNISNVTLSSDYYHFMKTPLKKGKSGSKDNLNAEPSCLVLAVKCDNLNNK